MTAPTGPELRDIHVPPPPDWWPPAPGWWLLALLVLALVVLAIYKIIQIHKTRRMRRAVLGELERCIAAAPHGVELAAALSQFLRRMTLRDARDAVALHGDAWLAHLDGRVGGEEFRRGAGRVLLDAPFRREAEVDDAALIASVRRWTRTALQAGAHHA